MGATRRFLWDPIAADHGVTHISESDTLPINGREGFMRILIAALLLAAGGTATTSPEEERLIVASIAQLKTELPDPSAAQFRKVYFFRSTTATGARHLGICGQLWVDDPRAPAGWTMFGGTMRDDGSAILQYWGPMAVRWCAQPYAGDWDYSRDLTARYQAAVGGGRH